MFKIKSFLMAAIATVFARYVGTFVTLSDGGTKIVAIAAICLLSAVKEGCRSSAVSLVRRVFKVPSGCIR